MSRIAFVVGPGFEDSELRAPLDALRAAGHQIDVLGVKAGEVVHGKRRTEEVAIEAAAADMDPESYDALVIPGGRSPGHLRTDPAVVKFVRGCVRANKIVAAICHGPQLLVEAGAVADKTLTSWPSVRAELVDAGATWVDREVVVDGSLITSRDPRDLPAFIAAIRDQLAARALRHAG
jgi:protease I